MALGRQANMFIEKTFIKEKIFFAKLSKAEKTDYLKTWYPIEWQEFCQRHKTTTEVK